MAEGALDSFWSYDLDPKYAPLAVEEPALANCAGCEVRFEILPSYHQTEKYLDKNSSSTQQSINSASTCTINRGVFERGQRYLCTALLCYSFVAVAPPVGGVFPVRESHDMPTCASLLGSSNSMAVGAGVGSASRTQYMHHGILTVATLTILFVLFLICPRIIIIVDALTVGS